MIDRNISVISTLAYALWVVGGTFIVLDFFYDPNLHAVGLFLAGAGGVLNIRSFFACQQQRERNAYEIGRDYADAPGRVRSLR